MSAFDWQEFLNAARLIFARCETLKQVDMADEAYCRIGISRAYYSAFHSAKRLADSETQVGGTHERVVRALKSSGDKTVRRIGNDLDKLREMRIRADYFPERYPERGAADNAVAELQKAISYAETIVRLARTFYG